MRKITKVFILTITVVFINSCSSDSNSDTSIFHKWYYKERVVGGITYPYIFGDCGKDYVQFYDGNKIKNVAIINCQPVMGSTGTFTNQENAISTTTSINGEIMTSSGIITELTEHSLIIQYDGDVYLDPETGVLWQNEIKYER